VAEKKETDVISRLYKTVKDRKGGDSQKSYSAKLFRRGREKICQKLGEEAVETVIAALKEGKKATILESADLLYHLTVLWAEMGIEPEDVMKELKKRMGTSGLEEKASRKKSSQYARGKPKKGKKPKRDK